MAELLIPADGEAHVTAEMNSRIAGVSFSTEIPKSPPSEFGRVVAVGGTGRDLVTDSPLFTLEGFATKKGRAFAICAGMVAALEQAGREGLVDGVAAGRVRVLGLPTNLPLPTLPDRYRFSATVSVDLRRTTV